MCCIFTTVQIWKQGQGSSFRSKKMGCQIRKHTVWSLWTFNSLLPASRCIIAHNIYWVWLWQKKTKWWGRWVATVQTATQICVILWFVNDGCNLFCSVVFVTKQEIMTAPLQSSYELISAWHRQKQYIVLLHCWPCRTNRYGSFLLATVWKPCPKSVSSKAENHDKTEKKVWHKYVTETRGIIKYGNKREVLLLKLLLHFCLVRLH